MHWSAAISIGVRLRIPLFSDNEHELIAPSGQKGAILCFYEDITWDSKTAISAGKEHRKAYRGSKQYDPTCRNHGGCERCLRARIHHTQKEFEKSRFSSRYEEINNPREESSIWQIT